MLTLFSMGVFTDQKQKTSERWYYYFFLNFVSLGASATKSWVKSRRVKSYSQGPWVMIASDINCIYTELKSDRSHIDIQATTRFCIRSQSLPLSVSLYFSLFFSPFLIFPLHLNFYPSPPKNILYNILYKIHYIKYFNNNQS